MTGSTRTIADATSSSLHVRTRGLHEHADCQSSRPVAHPRRTAVASDGRTHPAHHGHTRRRHLPCAAPAHPCPTLPAAHRVCARACAYLLYLRHLPLVLRLLLGHGVLQQPHLRGQLLGAHALLRVRALQLLQLRARLHQRLVRRLRAHLRLPALRAQLLLVPRDLALQVLRTSARRGEARRGRGGA